MNRSEWRTRKERIDTKLRVSQAMDKFLNVHTLTLDQVQWLSLVRELVKNLSMDEEDFDLTPLLSTRGGRAKALTVFGELNTVSLN